MNPWEIPQPNAAGLTAEQIMYLQQQQAQRAPAGLATNVWEKIGQKLGFTQPPAPVPPPRAPRGSGQSAKNTAKADTAIRLVSVENQPMTPEEFQQRHELISQTPAIRDQQAGIDRLDQLLNIGLDQPAQPDLSPLLALSDTWFGGNLSRGYARPESGMARLDKAKSYAAKIQGDKKELAQTILNAMGKIQGGKLTEDVGSKIGIGGEIGSKDPAMPGAGRGGNSAVNADRFLKTFRTDKTVASATEGLNAAKEIVKAEGRTDWLTQRNIQNALIKAARVSPVSDRDVARLSNSPGLYEKLITLQAKLLNNQALSPEDQAIAVAYGKFQLERNAEELENASTNYAKSMGPEYGYTQERALGLIRPPKGWGYMENAAPAKAPTQTGRRTPEQERRYQELLQKRK